MRPTRIEISRSALCHNAQLFRTLQPRAQLIAVVKANAYGHGMELVSSVLEPHVDAFGVAYAEEGAALRASGITKPIVVLMSLVESDAELVVAHRLEVCATSLAVMRAISRAARKAGVLVRAHLYVDTGMHRDGIAPEEVPRFAEQCAELENIELVGICTHFARSDERDCTMTTLQNERFARVLTELERCGWRFSIIHAANTGAALQHPQTHYSALRIGIGLYGIAPGEVTAPRLQPALRLVTHITALRRIEAGEAVSYGSFYTASRATTIATIPIGYGDGYTRMLTGKAECLIGGRRFPIVGAICMDECLVDVGDYPARIGEEVVLIGKQGSEEITARELANQLGTIPYEVLTLLGTRIPRVLVE